MLAEQTLSKVWLIFCETCNNNFELKEVKCSLSGVKTLCFVTMFLFPLCKWSRRPALIDALRL